MNNNNIELFGCGPKKRKAWRKKYKLKKVYTSVYVTNIYQELAWFFIITFFGIFGQLLFRLYYARICWHQWWWLIIIYFWAPIFSIIPAIFLCTHAFWIDKIEYFYNSKVKNNPNIPFIVKLFFKILFRLFKPNLIPFVYKDKY